MLSSDTKRKTAELIILSATIDGTCVGSTNGERNRDPD